MGGGTGNRNANHLYYYSYGQQIRGPGTWSWRIWGCSQSSEFWRSPFLSPAHLDVVMLLCSLWMSPMSCPWSCVGNYEIVCVCMCWGEIGQRPKHNDCLSQVGTAGGEKGQGCRPRAAVPVPPGPSAAVHVAGGILPHLQVKMKLKKSKFLLTAMKAQTPSILPPSGRPGKIVLPSNTVFPGPEGGLHLWVEHRKAASLVLRMIFTTINSKDGSGQESLWGRWLLPGPRAALLHLGLCFVSELDRLREKDLVACWSFVCGWQSFWAF